MRVIIDGKYYWDSGLSGVYSHEKKATEGELRFIDGALFRAGIVTPTRFYQKVLWWPLTEKELQPYMPRDSAFGGFRPRNVFSYEWERATKEERDARGYPIKEEGE